MPCTALPAASEPGARVPPLYTRLRQALRDRVASGEWRPGDRLPTIRQLCELYGVSRITVVQALDTLAREGLLQRWQGKGVFVSQPTPGQPRLLLLSFSEEAAGRGQAPASRVLRLAREPATPGLTARLGLRADEGVVFLERLRLVDGQPHALQQAYLPEHLVPGLLERSEPIDSLYKVLSDAYGLLPTSAIESYVPIHLGLDQARLLEADPGTPAFQIERTTSDQHGRTIEFVNSVFRADRHQIHLQLRR
jgi:GntR family transcriptional regulator